MRPFLKNVLKMSSGDISVQAINFVLIPIIIRIYSPEDYGIFSIFAAIIIILSPLSPLRYNYTLMLPEKRDESINLLALSFISVLIFSMVTAVILFFIYRYELLPHAWVELGFMDYLSLIPISILILGSCHTITFWAIRNKMFGVLPFSRISQSIVDKCFSISVGYFTNTSAFGLIGGRVAGAFVALCYLVNRVLINEMRYIIQVVSFKEMKRLARIYREYHLLASASLLLSKIAREIPLFLFGLIFSPVNIAYYALSMRIINLPITLLGDAISKVYFQRSTERRHYDESLAEDTTMLICGLTYIAFPMVIILIFFGKELFAFVFGLDWVEAGHYTQILIISFVGMFFYKPISSLFDTFKRQRQKIAIDLCLLIVRSAAILGGGFVFGSIKTTLWLLSLSTFIIYLCAIIYLIKMININSKAMLISIFKGSWRMAPVGFGIPLSYLYIETSYVKMSSILLISFLVQGILLLSFYLKFKPMETN